MDDCKNYNVQHGKNTDYCDKDDNDVGGVGAGGSGCCGAGGSGGCGAGGSGWWSCLR
jgi:hypothetical protein